MSNFLCMLYLCRIYISYVALMPNFFLACWTYIEFFFQYVSLISTKILHGSLFSTKNIDVSQTPTKNVNVVKRPTAKKWYVVKKSKQWAEEIWMLDLSRNNIFCVLLCEVCNMTRFDFSYTTGQRSILSGAVHKWCHLFLTNRPDPHPSPLFCDFVITMCSVLSSLDYPHPLKKMTSFMNSPSFYNRNE